MWVFAIGVGQIKENKDLSLCDGVYSVKIGDYMCLMVVVYNISVHYK